jgi:hypothetical protein
VDPNVDTFHNSGRPQKPPRALKTTMSTDDEWKRMLKVVDTFLTMPDCGESIGVK